MRLRLTVLDVSQSMKTRPSSISLLDLNLRHATPQPTSDSARLSTTIGSPFCCTADSASKAYGKLCISGR